jgi:hypothetical protein
LKSLQTLIAVMLSGCVADSSTSGNLAITVTSEASPSQHICAYSQYSAKSVLVDSKWIAGDCGQHGQGVQGATTDWWIQDISGLPIGETVEMCSGSYHPSNWSVVKVTNDVNKCQVYGQPPENSVQYIKRDS